MIVRLVKNWSAPNIMRQTPSGTGEWEGVQFTEEPVRDVDAVIVLNAPHLPIRGRCPPGRKILISQESPIPDYAWHQDSFSHFDQCYTFWPNGSNRAEGDFSPCLPWWVDKSYDQLASETLSTALPLKTRELSWVTSAQTKKPGHKLRMALLDQIRSDGVSLDLFGRGFNEVKAKDAGLDSYRYSLAIENFSCENYWTEKIADCFLAWTIPIYWGAPNLSRFFPGGSYVSLDLGDLPGATKKIRQLVESDHFGKNLSALAEARDLVLNQYQLFPYWAKRLSGSRATRPRSFSIPANPHYAGQRSGSLRLAAKFLRLFGH